MLIRLSVSPHAFVIICITAADRRFRPRWKMFFGPYIEVGPAEKIYTKSERLAVSCNVSGVRSERLNLCNRQVMILPRQTKLMRHCRAPFRTTRPRWFVPDLTPSLSSSLISLHINKHNYGSHYKLRQQTLTCQLGVISFTKLTYMSLRKFSKNAFILQPLALVRTKPASQKVKLFMLKSTSYKTTHSSGARTEGTTTVTYEDKSLP